MPDLTTHATYICCTNEHWEKQVKGSKGNTYTVSHSRLDPEESYRQGCDYGWTCTCKGFQFRGKCKHLTQVLASGEFCGWNDTLEVGVEPDYDEQGRPICPDCGGPVTAINVAV
jgi:hypothetical protein